MKYSGLLSRVSTLLLVILVLAACGGTTGTTTSATATSAGIVATTAPTEMPVATLAATEAATEATTSATMEVATAAATTAAATTEAATAEADMTETATAAATETMATPTTEAATTTATEAATTAATESATTAATESATTAAQPIPQGDGSTIRVGSKNFTEEFIVAEMYAQLLEANGFKVERKLNLGSEAVAQQALVDNEIDLYPEYTSTGLLTILKQQPIKDPQQIYDAVKSGYEQQFKLTWLKPSPFNDTNALAMTKKRADELGIKTYSDLAQKSGDLIIGGPPEFFAREDGLPGLQQAYGGFKFKEEKQLDAGLRYPALEQGQIDVVRAFSTDGQLGSPDLVLLKDDKTYYPIYQVAPVVRMDVLSAHPQIADILNQLATPKLDEKAMSQLNYMVDGPDKKEPADVAKQWLTEQGFLNK